jgi:mono/diheme cytochrome c family protein
MRYFQFERFAAVIALAASFGCFHLLAQTQQGQAGAQKPQEQPQAQAQPQSKPRPAKPTITGVGSAATQEDMGNVAWVTGPSGKGLPAGSGTAKQGAQIFMVKCSMCHGPDEHGVHWKPEGFSPIAGPPLALPRRGEGPHDPWIPPLTSGAPFPEAIFNTIAVEMPMFRPGTLTADEAYALTAFIFYKNGYVKEDDVLDRETLPKIKMPNSKYFPASDDVYMDMKKRGCWKTYGACVGE